MPVVIVFDGECTFCCRSVLWFQQRDRYQQLEFLARQSDARRQRFPQLDAPQYQGAMQCIAEDGHIVSGAMAVAEALTRLAAIQWRFVGYVMQLPVIRWFASLGYRLVARLRHRIRCDTGACQR